jgi:hypothetical protein
MLLGLGAWLGLALLFVDLSGGNLPTYRALRDRGVIASGTLVERRPANHGILGAEYRVDGRSYRCETSHVTLPNPPDCNLKVGDPVAVFYLPSQPERCALGDPAMLLQQEYRTVSLAAVACPTMILGAFLLRRKDRERRRKKESQAGPA